MRISDLHITPPLGPQNRNWSLLKISTDEGIEGLGEWAPGIGRERFEQIKKMLLGQDPMSINKLHYTRYPNFSLWELGGLGAGIEIALWDIMGKKLGVPVHQLFGGKLRDRIRIYADCHAGEFWTVDAIRSDWEEVRRAPALKPKYEPEAYAATACRMVADGFTAVKFDVDVPNPWKLDQFDRSVSRREHEHIVTAIEKIRQAIGPNVDLAIDLHGAFNMTDALRICKDVEHMDLLWLEDPVRWEWGNVDALVKLCMMTETPICTGEILYGAARHRELIVKQACDLLEPDIPRSGGAIEIRRIAELAEMYHMSIAPHNMDSTITAVFAVHLCSAIPNFLALEYHSGNIPLWGTMLKNLKNPIQHGYITVPETPGLGIELDEEELCKHVPAGQELWER